MPRLFISYSRTDEGFARQLATSLSIMGADIWIDIRDIPAGMKWSSAIQEGLNQSDAMIVVISPASMASPNVEDEWQYYRDRGKPIVPVLIQPAQLHYQLARLQYISFHTQPYPVALSQLHAELYRKGIVLNPPPNAVTQPVPRAPAAYAPTPSYPQRPAPARPARRSNSLVTLGCIGVLVIAAVVGGGALFASNLFSGASGPTQTAAASTQSAQTLAASGVTATPAPQHGLIRIMSESARLRRGPGTNYEQVGEVLSGETFEVEASAPSSTGTGEIWFLIDTARFGPAWISSVAVDLTPDSVVPPTAVTIPPTPQPVTPSGLPPSATPFTASATPNVSATPDVTVDFIEAQIAAAGVPYNFGFNAGRYTSLRVTTSNYVGAVMRIVVRNASGAVLVDQLEGSAVVPVVANADYTLEITDTNGGTGTFTIIVERSTGGF